METPDIKECIKGKVKFTHFYKGQLWYECENGFKFFVPVEDTGDGTFFAEDKAITFMRYIRLMIKLIEKGEG